MPYFITDSSPDCSGWATVKEDGEVMGCHTTKQAAVDQMVAISLAEDMTPGGERVASGPKAIIVDIDDTLIHNGQPMQRVIDYVDALDGRKFIVTARREAQRSETVAELERFDIKYSRLYMKNEDVVSSAYKKQIARDLLKTFDVYLAIDNDENNRQVFAELGIPTKDPATIPAIRLVRAINQDAPQYMRDAAKRGLELNAQGKGGAGLTDKTIREARLMVDGQVSDDKWIRIAAWIARHLVDLDAPQNSDSADSGYPGAGLVAHLLWGSGPTKANAERTMKYAESVVKRIREQESSRWSSVNILLRKEKEAKMNNKVERRIKNDIDFELRVDNAQSDGMSFTGYAAVFNSNSEPLPFTERILPGAFKRSLKSRNEVKLFKNHNMDEVLASTRSKTLSLIEDSTGLLAQATLPDTSAGRDLAVLMKRGDVHSMSFGFSVPNGGDSWSPDGTTRELKEIRLHEVSIVTGFPAYEATTASVRSLDGLAQVLGMDADMLEYVIGKLEDGEPLSSDQADLVLEIVAKLREDSPMADMPPADQMPSLDQIVMDELASLEIKRKHLDLLFKATHSE